MLSELVPERVKEASAFYQGVYPREEVNYGGFRCITGDSKYQSPTATAGSRVFKVASALEEIKRFS